MSAAPDIPPPAGPRMGPWPERVRDLSRIELITPEQFRSWILVETGEWIALDKPGWVVVHPSKRGPWSSLAGAAREYLGLPAIHPVFRLDRETSGVVLFAKTVPAARRLQRALMEGRMGKTYLAVLRGLLDGRAEVDRPLGPDTDAPVTIKQRVGGGPGFQDARTVFEPLAHGGGWTLARVTPLTGRKHQIRAHAEWLGHPVAGDKLYGGDPTLYLEHAEQGWTPRLEAALEMRRQALHAWRVDFSALDASMVFTAPPADDIVAFVRGRMRLASMPPWQPAGP